MTLTQNSHDTFRWLAARVILLSATPVVLLALTVCSLLFTAYGMDAQTPFGALAHSVISQAQSVPDALHRARKAFPQATIFYVENGAVVQSNGEVLHSPLQEQAERLVTSLTSPGAITHHSSAANSSQGYSMLTASPPLPESIAMAAVAMNASSGAVIVATPLKTLFPQMQFAWGMTLTVSGVLVILLMYNSLIFSGFVHQKLASEEMRRRALEYKMVEANRLSALGTLAAGIAHEINNPLSIMTQEAGWIEDLTQDDIPREDFTAKVRKSAEVIGTQGARCREITHNLLRLSRQGAVEAGAIDLNSITEEVAALSSHRCSRQGVTLDVQVQPDLPTAYAAQAHVQQILLNLAGNALDAMQNREHCILLMRTWEEDNRVCVAVADTGPGMSPAIRNRIFEPFFTTKPVGKGTGLGLAICYGLAKRNNGTLTVNSREGEGSTFVLKLPRMEPDNERLAADEDSYEVPVSQEPQPRSQGECA